MIQIEGMETEWVYFKFERLPIYCYRCGILGHQLRECHKAKKGCISSEEDDYQFGLGFVWWVLRAIGEEVHTVNQKLEKPRMT